MHQPVLLAEVISYFRSTGCKRFVDATLGLGGHTRAILDALPESQVLGIDRDKEALSLCRESFQAYEGRLHLVQSNYSDIKESLGVPGWNEVCGILADLGLSSFQLDNAERGFAFSRNGPLDMRMGDGDVTAAEIINTWDKDSLARIFKNYGEDRMAYRIAKAVVDNRPLDTTRELRDLLHRVKGPREGRIDSATRIFQALRIAVNRELDHLESFIPSAIEVLAPGGRLAVISFHSLEDRIVKSLFKQYSGKCICHPTLIGCRCNPVEAIRILTKKPVGATREEERVNPRSRSAKMRVAEKL